MSKLSRKSVIALIVGVFVIAYVSLGVPIMRQAQEQKGLDDELSMAEDNLAAYDLTDLYARKDELVQQLSQTLAEADSAKAALAQALESIAATRTLFHVAESHGVDITDISSSGSSTGDLEGIECITLPITVDVEGDTASLQGYVISLSSALETAIIDSVQISIPEPASDEEPEEEAEKSVASINIVIYIYQDD